MAPTHTRLAPDSATLGRGGAADANAATHEAITAYASAQRGGGLQQALCSGTRVAHNESEPATTFPLRRSKGCGSVAALVSIEALGRPLGGILSEHSTRVATAGYAYSRDSTPLTTPETPNAAVTIAEESAPSPRGRGQA